VFFVSSSITGKSKDDMKAWNEFFWWAADVPLRQLAAMSKEQTWEKFKEFGGEKQVFEDKLWPVVFAETIFERKKDYV